MLSFVLHKRDCDNTNSGNNWNVYFYISVRKVWPYPNVKLQNLEQLAPSLPLKSVLNEIGTNVKFVIVKPNSQCRRNDFC